MKFNTNKGLFIQEIDIQTVHDINCGLPRSACEERVQQLGILHPSVDDRFFHCFTNSKSISFLDGIDFLLDYNFAKELTIEQINEMLASYSEELNELLQEQYYATIKRKPYDAEKSKKIKTKQHFCNELRYYAENKEQIDIEIHRLLGTKKVLKPKK